MIDWSVFDQNGYEEYTCYCRCGAVYRSHHKIDYETRKGISRKPCPGCRKNDDVFRASSDPEYIVIK